MSNAGEPITLYIYDLSNGLAATFGEQLTGRRIEGIWHTSLVLFGMEVFYGQGIDIVRPPGTTHHGSPKKTLSMGTTQLDQATFLEYIEGLKSVYRADKYHLLDFNCNSFTNDVSGFLNGSSIPEDIRNLPRDILATPFGRQMRPMIDQMFSGRSGPSAPAEPRTFSDPSPQSIASNLQICTSPASLQTILDSNPAVAVMYTSSSCPPCEAIKPLFNDLARTHGATTNKQRIDFVLVEMGVGAGAETAARREFCGPVKATPTFVFFRKGEKVGECKGADGTELKTQVAMLEMVAYPPHPHTNMYLPELTKLSKSLAPITYVTLPNLTTLSAKLTSFLTDASMTSVNLPPATAPFLTKSVIAYLSAPKSIRVDTAQWTAATLSALDALPPSEWFPVVDLWRVGLAVDSIALTPVFSKLLPQLLSTKYLLREDLDSKPLLLTTIRLIANALASPALSSELLGETLRSSVTSIVVKALLDADKGVRKDGAGLGWSIVSRMWASREKGGQDCGEEWEIEVGSAVLEALERETEGEVGKGASDLFGFSSILIALPASTVHRLAATLGLLLLKSPHHESLQSLLEVLGAGEILKNKEKILGDKLEVVKLLKEVQSLCSEDI